MKPGNRVLLRSFNNPMYVAAWLAVMKISLSVEGYDRVLAEWKADDALAALEGSAAGGGAQFGSKFYYLALIGTPSATAPWMWQFGGHHDRAVEHEAPTGQLCAIAQVHVLGERLVRPPARILDAATAPDPGGAVEVEEQPAAHAHGVLQQEMRIEHHRLRGRE